MTRVAVPGSPDPATVPRVDLPTADLPTADHLPRGRPVDDGTSFSDGDEHQQTTASLVVVHDIHTRAELRALVSAVTHTWTNNAFVGFTGNARVSLGPNYFPTGEHAFGATGTWDSNPNRTDSWSESVPLSLADADRGGSISTATRFSS